MAELMCFFCFKTYDSLIGHYCLNGWWIPGVANRNTTVEAVADEPDSLMKGSTHGPCVQINESASVGTKLVNINSDFPNKNYLYNQVTYGNDQQTYSNQDYTTGGASNHLMAMNSEQNHVEERAIGGLDNEARRKELCPKDCSMPMRLSFPHTDISSNIEQMTSMVSHLGLDKENLSLLSVRNSYNDRNDLAPVSGAIDSMPPYKVPKLDVVEDVQSEPRIQNDPSKLIIEGSHGYDIISISNDVPVLYEYRDRIYHELVMVNKPGREIEDHIRSSEMYHQFSKYRRDTQNILTISDLDSKNDNFAVAEAEPSRDLVFSNILTHGSPEHTGSINDQVRLNRSNAEMLLHKCTNASTESEIVLNDMNFRRGTEESATIGNSFTEKSDFFEDCHVDAAHALAGPSFSQFNESCISAYLKEFQSNGNVKLHSMQRNSHLKRDMIIYKAIKVYKCNLCKKSFRRREHLQRHAFTHTGDKPFQCEVCRKKFSTKSNLYNHMKIHKGIKQYKCDACGKSFTEKGNLKTHARIHTGEKPFECEVCRKSFSDKGNLKRHARTHTGEKPFECDACGKSFTEKGSLKRHAGTHTGEKTFECEVCGKLFRRKEQLQRHVLTHTSDKPHECIICGKKFSQVSNLHSHKKTHKLK
ncbi:Zinc finger protein 782 [Araneus ventricosus]|uniref:Zinc finger protein 782 n=1 Tax=Araneus ventricosus TaxID=182803 RepID=A0A4Y2QLE9_ARAVE|nr:Zinc finger protein 782 [Araneus ventricosus]